MCVEYAISTHLFIGACRNEDGAASKAERQSLWGCKSLCLDQRRTQQLIHNKSKKNFSIFQLRLAIFKRPIQQFDTYLVFYVVGSCFFYIGRYRKVSVEVQFLGVHW